MRLLTTIMHRLFIAALLLLKGATAWGEVGIHPDSVRTPTEAEADSLRQTDGFVTASLIVASPGEEVYSSLGHCALRMECPVYGLDYCFSFEMNTGIAATDYLVFFSGRSPAGFLAMETPTYLQRFKGEGRSIVQYTLNLTPKEKQELWRRLDQNMMVGINSQFDFLYHNCTSMCLIALQSQLIDERLVVKEWPEVMRQRPSQCFLRYSRHVPWMQFVLMTLWGTKADWNPPQEMYVAPETIGEVLSHAVIIGTDGSERPALTGQPRQLQPQTLSLHPSWFTPLHLAIILLALVLLLTLGQWLWGWGRVALSVDVVLLAVQALLGVVLLYLVLVSRLFGQQWNWCLLLFSPLPLAMWLCCRRRAFYRRLSLLYGIVLLLLAIAAPLVTSQLIAAHRLVAAAIALRSISCALGQQSVKNQ